MTTSSALAAAMAAAERAVTEPVSAIRLGEAALARAGGEPEPVTVARRALGMACTALGRLAEAERHLRAAITVASRAGLTARAGEARGSLGYALTLMGRTAEALRVLDRAAPDLTGVPAARLAMVRGTVLTEIDRFDEAGASFGAALALLRRGAGDAVLEADIRTNRSILSVHLRDWRAAEDDLRRAEAIYTTAGHLGRTAMVYHNRGLAAAVRGDVPAALTAFDESERRYRDAGRDLGLLPIERAETLLSVRLVGEAREAAAAAVERYSRQHNVVDLVQARLVLAEAALLAGDVGTAHAQAEQALRSAARQQRTGWAALARHVALRARWSGGERGEALLRAARRAVRTLTAEGWTVPALDARLIVAELAMDLGRPGAARRELASVGAAVRRSAPAQVRARAWYARAVLRLAEGDRPGAGAAVLAGMRTLDEFQAGLGAAELRAHAGGHAVALSRLGVRLGLESGRADAVLSWAERSRARALLLRPVRPPDDPRLAGYLAELRQVAAELGDVDGSRDTSALLRRQTLVERQVRDRTRQVAGRRAVAALPTTGALVAALGDGALVEYVTSADRLYAVTLADGRARLHELGAMAAVAEDVAALRFGMRSLGARLERGRPPGTAARLLRERALRLDEVLLRPLAELEDRPLVIVPTGVLHTVAWHALPGCAHRPVSVAPSAALWHRAVTAADPGGRAVFVAGPGLPHAVGEVRALAARPGAVRLTGRRATVDAVTAAIDGAWLAHIAAHGTLRADNPLFSSLRLAGGPLMAYDLERLDRVPRHLVLSACDSGLPAVHEGDELLGFAALLLSLGTTGVVASVLPVSDRATRALMLRLHRYVDKGLGLAAALSRARQDVSDGDESAWLAAATFTCLGAGWSR